MRMYSKLALAVLVPVLFGGCLLVSGTFTFTHEIDEFVSSNGAFQAREIDLTQDKDYNDNKDKIQSVDQVSVVGWFFNMSPQDNSAEIYIADVGTYQNADEVRANATRVFTTPEISGNDSLFVKWSDALGMIENLPVLKDKAEAGYFWLYGIAASSPFTMRFEATLVITITAD